MIPIWYKKWKNISTLRIFSNRKRVKLFSALKNMPQFRENRVMNFLIIRYLAYFWNFIELSWEHYLTESSKSPAEQLFGIEPRSDANCEYPLDKDCVEWISTWYENIFSIENICRNDYSKDIKRNTKTNSPEQTDWGNNKN